MVETEKVDIVLEYDGPEVVDGTMPIDDLVPVLQGVAGAYGTIAAHQGITVKHKLRLVGIQRGSAKIILDVWDMVGHNANQLQAVGSVVAASAAILTVVLGVITLKKHTRKEPYSATAEGMTQQINIVNSRHVSLSVPLTVFNAFKEGIIDSDLAKIASPLQEGSVDSSLISVQAGAMNESEKIEYVDKYVFETANPIATIAPETWLLGSINAMTKSTNSGFLYLADGTRVHFRIKTQNPEKFYHLFSHGGPVRVLASASLDSSLRPIDLVISDMVAIQGDLFRPIDH